MITYCWKNQVTKLWVCFRPFTCHATCMYTWSKLHTHTHTHTRARARARTPTPTRTHARARARAHTHTRTHARARTHAHTHTHTHTQCPVYVPLNLNEEERKLKQWNIATPSSLQHWLSSNSFLSLMKLQGSTGAWEDFASVTVFLSIPFLLLSQQRTVNRRSRAVQKTLLKKQGREPVSATWTNLQRLIVYLRCQCRLLGRRPFYLVFFDINYTRLILRLWRYQHGSIKCTKTTTNGFVCFLILKHIWI